MTDLHEIRKPRSATTSNLDDTIPEGRALPERRTSFLESGGTSGRRLSHLFSWRMGKKRQSTDFSTTSLANAQKNNTVNVYRPVYTQKHFDTGFNMQEKEGIPMRQRLRKCFTCDCSKKCWKDALFKFLPFINIMKSYSPRDDITGDIIAGLTVGIMNIPQGMAYALLANMSPIYGLYVSFFPVIVYFFFGGSKHISVGTFAVVSLMAGSAIDSQYEACMKAATGAVDSSMSTTTMGTLNGTLDDNITTTTATIAAAAVNTTITACSKVNIAASLTLLVGLFQILMGFLRLGFVTIYLADPLISGFTTGAACHVFTSQVKHVVGISNLEKTNGPFKLINTYIDIFTKITGINWAAVITAAICMIVLILVKECINDRCKSRMKMPVPIDLIVVVVSTLVSYFAQLNNRYELSILGNIPSGFPAPHVPILSDVTTLIPSAFTISVIAFAVSVSMSKIFAKKHNYEIDSNQEFLAYGMCNVFSSFFQCFPSCASLSRSAVQDNQGGKSQLAGIISAVLVFIVMMALGTYFEPLPKAVLAAIILVALKGMFRQFRELKRLWSISYYDFSIWLVTWLGVVIVDVDIGLAIGVVFGLLTVVFRTQYPPTTILGRVPHTDLYKDKEIYPTVAEVPGIKIFRIDASLYYANVEHFRQKLYKLTEVNPRTIKVGRAKIQTKVDKEIKAKTKMQTKRKRQANKKLGDVDHETSSLPANGYDHDIDMKAMPSLEAQLDAVGREDGSIDVVPADKRDGWPVPVAHHIIIDCGMMSYIDSVGVNMLKSVYSEYKDVDVAVFLVNCKPSVSDMFYRCSFYEKMSEDNIYLTIHDAVIAALAQKRELQEEVARDTKIVSRPSSIYGSRNASVANLLTHRRSSQPAGLTRPRGSSVGIVHLPPQGEDNELSEMDGENNKTDDPSSDPVNGEVSESPSNPNLASIKESHPRKQSCHM